jgi:diaminopimelate decarboxylase
VSTGTSRLAELVHRYGSPLYVYDLGSVTAAWNALRAARPAEATQFYSLKANPHPALVAHLRALGARAEVSSLGELQVSVAAGFPAAQTLMTGPAKTERLLGGALAAGCRLFSVESSAELARLSAAAQAAGAVVTALLRVNVDDPIKSAGLSFGGVPSQFGTDLSVLLDMLGRGGIPACGPVRVAGAHFFLATNLVDEAALMANFGSAIAAAVRLEQAGLPMAVLDLGGGFGAPYGKAGPLPAYPRLRDFLDTTLREMWPGWPDRGPELWFESGRYLVGTAGTLAATVVEIKHSKGERFVVLDSGIHHLGGMTGLRRLAQLDLELCLAASGQCEPSSAPARVVGPLCTTLDSWSLRATSLPDARPGDIVCVPNVGAYGLSASLLAFLSHDCPVEVVVSAAGEAHASRLVVERRTALSTFDPATFDPATARSGE